ncbi:TetR/AcrR family transcriptional regulator [Nocardia miyunensis]|uniref:TetR/AcrR family transcriptional regulator n=1 Tax=Nocardia miyunensis TaxID=282684 RepID=UPI00082B77BB|nr:TetR/AcrR family transcriptional regulator [Nocardia miyunensis]
MAETGTDRVRRPRMGPERELELLSVAMDLLREVGYEALTMDQLAVRGHCSKATLYRMWPGKLPLVLAAMKATAPPAIHIDAGSLRGDLLAFCARLIPKTEADTATIAAVNHTVLNHPELAMAVRTTLLAADAQQLETFIERAVARGELTSRPPAADLLPQVLFGLTFAQPLYEGSFVDLDTLVRVIDQILLPALGCSPPAR